MKYAKPKVEIEIRAIPPLTIDEDAFLLREGKLLPWKRMTRQEIEEQFPDVLKPIGSPSTQER